MSGLIHLVDNLCTEITSDNLNTRSKAAKKLEELLTGSKYELVRQLSQDNESDVSWTRIFNSTIQGAIKHASKVEDSKNSKTYQTTKNKNYLFNAIINKVINYHLEDRNHPLSKTTLLTAFIDGYKSRACIEQFGDMFLSIMSQGILKSPNHICELKVNEFSIILSYLFETRDNVESAFRFATLKCAVKFVELAQQHILINADIIDYYPEVLVFLKTANDDGRRIDSLRLYHLIVSQFCVEYYHTISMGIQETLPIILNYYEYNTRRELKDILFKCLLVSVNGLFPHLHQGSLNTANLSLVETWHKIARKLHTIIIMEIKERANNRRFQILQESSNDETDVFVQLAARTIYIVDWHVNLDKERGTDIETAESNAKIIKRADKLESLLKNVRNGDGQFNRVWLAILAELLNCIDGSIGLINLGNIKQLFSIVIDLLHNYTITNELRNIRRCIESLLRQRNALVSQKFPGDDLCTSECLKVVQFILSDTKTESSLIEEKQMLLQLFITNRLLNVEQCSKLMGLFMSSNVYRRADTIMTVQCILLNALQLGFEKAATIVTSCLEWVYDDSNKNVGQNILMNMKPIRAELIAETSALAMINLLQEENTTSPPKMDNRHDFNLFQYKYNRKFICLERIEEEEGRVQEDQQTQLNQSDVKTCLLIGNYEYVMRLLDVKSSQDTSVAAILQDLEHLRRIVLLMGYLLRYEIFDMDTYTQCPLIKRTGIFLSHLELQFKSNKASRIECSTLSRLLRLLEEIYTCIVQNNVLLGFLEMQPIDEMMSFLGTAIQYSGKEISNNPDNEDRKEIFSRSLRISCLLCASTTHWKETFQHVCAHKFDLNSTFQVNVIIQLIQVICSQYLSYNEIAEWFIDRLKLIFKLFHTNIEITAALIEIIPNIFRYVREYPDYLDVMLIAVHSLLKKCFRKLYPEELISKIVLCIGGIGQQCAQLYNNGNYQAIFKSVMQLITVGSLHIQCSIIKTLAIMLRTNYLRIAEENESFSVQRYYEFCDDVYRSIDFDKLQMLTEQYKSTNIDQYKNIVAINVQLLVTIVTFSDFHRIDALMELCGLYFRHELSENDLGDLKQLATRHHTTLHNFMKPCLSTCIRQWIEKSRPISRFPYYFCYENREKFLEDNMQEIVTFLLIYDKEATFQNLFSCGTRKDTIELSSPLIRVLLLLHRELELDVEGINNLMELGLRISLHLDVEEEDERVSYTLYTLLDMLNDSQYLETIIGSTKVLTSSKWPHISYEGLKKCLKAYLSKGSTLNLTRLLQDRPLSLVKVLSAVKEDCHTSIFFLDNLRNFHKFRVFAEIILNSFVPGTLSDHVMSFFACDVIFYTLNVLEKTSIDIIKRYAVQTLRQFLDKVFSISSVANTFIPSNCVFICEALVRTIDKCELDDIVKRIKSILKLFIRSDIVKAGTKTQIMQILLNISDLAEERNLLNELLTSNDEKDWKCKINEFVRHSSCSAESLSVLKQQIFQNKQYLQNDAELLCQLVRKLLQLARHSQSKEVALVALKCLGEIGPLRLPQGSFYIQASESTQEMYTVENPVLHFYKTLCTIIEEQIIHYDHSTNSLFITLACYLSVSKHAECLPGDNYLSIFRVKLKDNYFNSYGDISALNWTELLKGTENCADYESWIKHISTDLWQKCRWKHLYKLAGSNLMLGEVLLIPFLQLLLTISKECHLEGLLSMLNYYFESFLEVSTQSKPPASVIYRDKRIVYTMLEIVECVRIKNTWDLPLQLLNVARACNYCQAYFHSVMYLEIWAMDEVNKGENSLYAIMANGDFQVIAKEAYEAIGCLDAISGFIDPLKSRLEYLHINGNWSDILIESSGQNKYYMPVLKQNGMFEFASSATGHNTDYELYWRLCRWDPPVEASRESDSLDVNLEQEFHKHHFHALKCIKNREENNCLASISRARQCILTILQGISLECLQSVYKYVTWLELLQQADDFCAIQFVRDSPIRDILTNWRLKSEELHYGNFQCHENIVSHQITLFTVAGIRAKRKIHEFYQDDPVPLSLYRCIKDCRNANELNLAKHYIFLLKNATNDTNNTKMKVAALLEDADLCIQSGRGAISKAILQEILNNPDYNHCLERVYALQMKGRLQLDTNSMCFEVVASKYFRGSLELLQKFQNSQEENQDKHPPWNEFEAFEAKHKRSAYELIGKYADREYTQLLDYINSDQCNLKRKIISLSRTTTDSVGRERTGDRDKATGALFMKRFLNLDEKEISAIEEKLAENLCTAVENYLQYCCYDEAVTSPIIYRVIALWFANQQNPELQEIIEKHIGTVPSYKFVCALNQLTAGFNLKNSKFLGLLKGIMIRCLQDHPHQTLQQLFPLLCDNIDKKAKEQNVARCKIAKEVVYATEITSNAATSEIVREFEQVVPALIEFANMDTRLQGRKSFQLSEKLLRLTNLSRVHCLTLELPTRTDLNYEIISIVKWLPTVELVGGINAPKKLKCLCSDGVTRVQLLKGNDDLHQDAVMQQVFSMINELLQKDQSIRNRLAMRTYKVLPLSPRTGIIEWCENSVPLGTYLKEAHMRYRPTDYQINKCRLLVSQHGKAEFEKRYHIYTHVCRHIKPVLHYFFYERFPMAGVWFEKRLAYTNSIAISSIVGYVLGLGDRHCQNILLDEKTAEAIHIDFGIAFEQGKIMPTPETVPFRLTREILAPMGLGAQNGVFKKSCQDTLSVLRNHKVIIIAILEVLLYDPLYMWKVVPQVNDAEFANEKNLMAQRALLTVQNKLEGRESGLSDVASINVHVERLINEATSSRNLCLLYAGWDPYL